MKVPYKVRLRISCTENKRDRFSPEMWGLIRQKCVFKFKIIYYSKRLLAWIPLHILPIPILTTFQGSPGSLLSLRAVPKKFTVNNALSFTEWKTRLIEMFQGILSHLFTRLGPLQFLLTSPKSKGSWKGNTPEEFRSLHQSRQPWQCGWGRSWKQMSELLQRVEKWQDKLFQVERAEGHRGDYILTMSFVKIVI